MAYVFIGRLRLSTGPMGDLVAWGRTGMRLGLWTVMLALATPAATQAADFRLMDTAATSVMVADLSSIAKDASGVRRVTIYTASFAPMQVNGKIFQFISGLWAFDCEKNQFRSESIDILAPDFTVADHSGAQSQWEPPADKPPPASDFATYCARSPGRVSDAERLAASDWRAAIQEALAKARAATPPTVQP
jgi:hypothetical protein